MQARDVTFSVADPDVDIVGGFPDGPVTPPSLTWVAPSPASGATGVASGNFIATLLHGTASVTVTPSSDKAGTWAPTSRTLTPEAATGNFTFTASEAGFHSVTLTNDAGISAPAAVTFTATEVPALAFVAPDTATAGVTITGTITASGAASGPWSLNVPSGWTVSPSSGASVAPGSPVTINVTATEGTQSLTLTCSGATITGNPQSIVVSAAGGGLTVGAQVYTLAATNLSGSGSRPFSATVLPLRGAVPSGERLTDSTGAFDSTVLSTHDDGSAAVVVVSGTASGTGTLNLHRATGSTTALTAAAIGALVTSVEVAFGAPYGTASLTDFSTPERTWWANSKTICARYRVAAPTPGSTALEAVIDIHAWAGRALVEVAVENSKFDAAASTSSTKPAAATYASAVVSINGSTVATVAASGAAEGSHGAFRAWYASGWVGAGNPGLRVTQAVSDLQEHPLLWRMDAANSADLSTYAADAYAPWGTGRHRATNMGGTGDHASIGPLPKWEAQALQSGDYRAWNAVEVSTLSMLSYNINHRDSVTGRVPDSSLMAQKCQGSFWANWPKNTAEPAFEVAHQPAAGLMAFIGRPSPVFIEIAQKVAVWTGTVDSTRDLFNNFNESAVGITDSTGIVGNQQIRSKAWGPRNIAHATFLSPDTHPWKAGGLEWLDRNTRYLQSYAANTRNVLLPLWEGEPDAPSDVDGGQSGYQVSLWMYHFCVTEWHKIAASGMLGGISTARQTAVDAVADGLALPVVKWVNEQPNGGWRFLPYRTRLGDTSGDMTVYSTWTAQRAADLSGAPSTVTGQFSGASIGSETTWAAVEGLGYESAAYGASLYTANFWAALMAACERGVTGAATAATTVLSGITNLSTWRLPFGSDPRWGSYALNAPVIGFAAGASTGTLVGDLWTPAKTAGVVNAVSWAIVPTGRWIEVAGTRLDALDAEVKAAIPGWQDYGNSDWVGVTHAWNEPAWDQAGVRAWWVAAGGHSDSSNNGIYGWSGYKMSYFIEHLPSDTNAWSSGYKTNCSSGTATTCGESDAARIAAGGSWSVVNDWDYDELFWDRQPTSRHTYSGALFNPTTNELILVCRRLWRYSLTAGAWTYKRVYKDDRAANLGESIVAVLDNASQQILIGACGSGGPSKADYNLTTNTWSAGTGNWDDWLWNGAANAVRNGVISVARMPDPAGGNANEIGGASVNVNISTRAVTFAGYQYSGGLSGASFGSADDTNGMVWVPDVNKFWLNVKAAGGGRMWVTMDPTTSPNWEIAPLTFANAAPTLSAGNGVVRGRMGYFPALRSVVWFGSADKNIQLYRLA